MGSTERLRKQTGTTTGDCTACGTSGELTIWESWTPTRGRLFGGGRRDVRVSLKCSACGYRMPMPMSA